MKSNKNLLLDIVLVRDYFKTATNGTLYIDGEKHSHTIELPWKDNRPQVSCIPEGRYQLVKRYSEHFGHHVQLLNVPNRDLILIHPANNAVKELKGCIAPVTTLTGEGLGSQSRNVFEPLRDKIYHVLDHGYPVFITITSSNEINHQLASLRQDLTTYKVRGSNILAAAVKTSLINNNITNDKK